ncbi:hypothetical protein [Ruegeria faecimaris]|uniref:hypothetical protein n=1 Tax=Ruegeria faecimaris TaxID=686389 RepID=UPI00249079C0|nr:hypothetical protein [Ruegeria faecimaris]
MNANRIIDMIVRQVMRRLVTKGVDKGFDMASRVGQKSGQGQPPHESSGASDQLQADGNRQRQNMRQVQRVANQMRRFIRF